jgi:Putative beta barrel porin-7 (BBP7)
MRKGFLGSLAVLALGAGLSYGQYGPPPGPGGPSGPPPGPVGMPGNGGPGYTSPSGQPVIMPPGLEGMVPPGSMGLGSPQGEYPGANKGILYGLFNGGNGPSRFWLGVDYLFWIPKSQDLRFPLVTTSAMADMGVLGKSTTIELLGPSSDINYDQTNGFRVWAGYSLDGEGQSGVEISAFALEYAKQYYTANSNSSGLPLLAVPFFDLDNNAPGSYLVAFPGINAGGVREDAWTRVRNVEASFVYNAAVSSGEPGGLTLFAGARFFQLEESLAFSTTSSTFGVPPVGTGSSFFPGGGGLFAGAVFPAAPYTVATVDRTRTYNNFYGGNVGFRGDIGFGRWVIQATGKIAAGYMQSWVDIDGYSTLTPSSGPTSLQPGGLFNGPQDLGRHHKDRFAILPEGGVNIGYQLTPSIRLNAGYTFMYVNNVIRPNTSISQNLNSTLVPVSPTYTGAFPTNFVPHDVTRETQFYLQGINVGLQLSF